MLHFSVSNLICLARRARNLICLARRARFRFFSDAKIWRNRPSPMIFCVFFLESMRHIASFATFSPTPFHFCRKTVRYIHNMASLQCSPPLQTLLRSRRCHLRGRRPPSVAKPRGLSAPAVGTCLMHVRTPRGPPKSSVPS